MAVDIETDPELEIGTPRVLFRTRMVIAALVRTYDVAPDGRLLFVKRETPPPDEVTEPSVVLE